MKPYCHNTPNEIHATLVLADEPIDHSEYPQAHGNIQPTAHIGHHNNLVQLELTMPRDNPTGNADHVLDALRKHTWCPPETTLPKGTITQMLASMRARVLRSS